MIRSYNLEFSQYKAVKRNKGEKNIENVSSKENTESACNNSQLGKPRLCVTKEIDQEKSWKSFRGVITLTRIV